MKKKNILAVDINKESLEETEKLGVKTLNSDLFLKVEGKFDLIAFNPPYLPEDKNDKEKDTTGGKKGWEAIERFLKQAKTHLTEKGKILLLFSSLTNRGKIEQLIKKNKFSFKQAAEKKLFMEELFVYDLQKS